MKMAPILPLLFLLSAAVLSASDGDDLLPSELNGWQRDSYQRVNAVELAVVSGDEAALLLEYGSQRAESARYRRDTAAWQLVVHHMLDRSSAYGVFTLLRAGGTPLPLGEAAAHVGDRIVFYQGNYFVVADATARRPALAALARHLEAQAGRQPALPNLPYYLPQTGFVPGTDYYLLGPLALARVAPFGPGDWGGFAYGAEAESARYRLKGGEATLVLFSYPTPQIASERLRDLQRLFDFNGEGDPARPRAFGRRTGTFVAFVGGPLSPAAANGLLDQVRYERQLSWSRPGESRVEEDWAETVVSLFIGAGLFILLTLALALAFAVFRMLVERLWPGKVFGRRDAAEIIRLDLDRDR